MADENSGFRATVRQAHAPAFGVHREIAIALEDAFVSPRPHPTAVATVLDMFMFQGYKAHLAVWLLCERAMVEDAATITRRLLEIGVQAVYIGAESETTERNRRAGRFLAFMWRQVPRRLKIAFPPAIKEHWSKLARSYGRLVPANARTWGPNWFEMFKAIGGERLYRKDYSLLSAIAHGRPDEMIFTYSHSTVPVHAHHHVSTLLRYSSRYYLSIAEQWNREFAALPASAIPALFKRVT